MLDFRLMLMAMSGHEMFLTRNGTMQKIKVVQRKGSRVRY